MIPTTIQTLAKKCFNHADAVLSILDRAAELRGPAFPQETLLASVSYSRRSEAIAALELLTLEDVFEQADNIYTCHLTKDELKTLYSLIKGMTLISKDTSGQQSVEIVLTLPKQPNQLEPALRNIGPQVGLIQKTDEVFDHLAHQAQQSLIIMTPFLDDAGAKFLLRLFGKVDGDVEKIVILRFISLGPGYTKFPSGYPPIRDELKAMGVKVYDYAVKRSNDWMLETFHAKAILSDDKKAYIGSSNLDQYSLENSMELGVFLTGEPVKLVHRILKSILLISTNH